MKNNFGPRGSGGDENGDGIELESGCSSSSGVVIDDADAAREDEPRANKLGVMVAALPELPLSVDRAVSRRGRMLVVGLMDDIASGSGDERADW